MDGLPWHQRLDYRNTPGTFVYDEANETLYLNGTVQLAGTLYIDHIKDSPEIENNDSSSGKRHHSAFGIRRRHRHASSTVPHCLPSAHPAGPE